MKMKDLLKEDKNLAIGPVAKVFRETILLELEKEIDEGTALVLASDLSRILFNKFNISPRYK